MASHSQPSAGHERITLCVRDVALAAKKAFDEGRLSAQGPTPECRYRDRSGNPCAIGAALTEEQASRIPLRLNGRGVGALIEQGLLGTDDRAALRDLQYAHDNWATGGGDSARDAFLAVLSSILETSQ